MLLKIARVLAGVGALYQGGVGLLAIVSPAAAGIVYQLRHLTPVSAALTRILGGLMAGNALILAAFAWRPEANPALPLLLAVGAIVNVAADVGACLAGEIRWEQVAGSMLFQLLFGAVLAVQLLHTHSHRKSLARTPQSPR